MKILIPVDDSDAALAPIPHLASLVHSGIRIEVVVLNVQPPFHRHLVRFTSRAARDALRAELSEAAMARAIEALSKAGIPFRALSDTGVASERIAAVAERERVDEIMIGTGRHPAWLRFLNPSVAQDAMQLTDIPVTVFARGHASAFERYAIPAGAAGMAALLLAAE